MAFLPGFRFHPTDEEILQHYLPRWSAGEDLEPSLVHLIREVELYSKEPDKIYADLGIPQDQPGELYFFTLVKRKFSWKSDNDNNIMERVAGIGTWTSQKSIPIFASGTKRVIGYKNVLNFQIKKKNLKPSWIMHEYTLPNTQHLDHFWAFCGVKRGTNANKDNNKSPLFESTPQAKDVLRAKKRRVMNIDAGLSWETLDPQTFMPPCNLKVPSVGNSEASTSYAPQGDNGVQIDLHHQPTSHICAQIKDVKDKGKRALVEESTAEVGICINKTRSLTPAATYPEMNEATTSLQQSDNRALKCVSLHQYLHHQPTTTTQSPIILSPSVRHEAPEEPLHHFGTSGVPGQARMLELGGCFDGFNDLPDSGSFWDFDSSSDPILNADINAMSGLLNDYDFISPQQWQNPNFMDLLLA